MHNVLTLLHSQFNASSTHCESPKNTIWTLSLQVRKTKGCPRLRGYPTRCMSKSIHSMPLYIRFSCHSTTLTSIRFRIFNSSSSFYRFLSAWICIDEPIYIATCLHVCMAIVGLLGSIATSLSNVKQGVKLNAKCKS